jgi:hypothetical protein
LIQASEQEDIVMNKNEAKSSPLSTRHMLAIAAAITLASTASFAIGTSAQRAACTPDVFRLCSSEIPSVTGIVSCLRRQRPNLSPACQAVFNAMDEKPAVAQRPATAPQHVAAINTPPAPEPKRVSTRSLPPTTPADLAATHNAALPVAPQGGAAQNTQAAAHDAPATAAPDVAAAHDTPAAVSAATATARSASALSPAPPQTAVACLDAPSAKQASKREGGLDHRTVASSLGDYRERSRSRHGGLLARFGGVGPIVALVGGGQGGIDVGQIVGAARGMGYIGYGRY